MGHSYGRYDQPVAPLFFEPARGAVIPQIVPTRGLLSANALSGATWSAMLALGAFLGGIATRRLGRDGAYVIDAASFLLSAGLVWSARLPKLPREAPREAHVPEISAMREGARYLRTHPAQALASCLKGGWGLVGGIAVLFTAFADQVFTVNNAAAAASAIGLLYCGRGIGALVGPFIARRFAGESISGLTRAVLISFPVAAIGYFAFGLAPTVWFAALALVVAHCGGSTVWVHSTQLLQLTVPNRLLGRVFAVEWAGLTAAMCVSTLITSALLDVGRWTPRHVAFAIGVVPLVVATLWAMVRPRIAPRLEADARSIAEDQATRS